MTSSEPEQRRGAEGAERTVLVVEDEAGLLRFLRATLPAAGYRVIEAGTGQQALVEAATRSPDVILLDLGLPDMDGVEVARRIRSDPALRATPIVAMTAESVDDARERFGEVVVNAYLAKPVEPAALAEVVSRFLPTRRASSPAS